MIQLDKSQEKQLVMDIRKPNAVCVYLSVQLSKHRCLTTMTCKAGEISNGRTHLLKCTKAEWSKMAVFLDCQDRCVWCFFFPALMLLRLSSLCALCVLDVCFSNKKVRPPVRKWLSVWPTAADGTPTSLAMFRCDIINGENREWLMEGGGASRVWTIPTSRHMTWARLRTTIPHLIGFVSLLHTQMSLTSNHLSPSMSAN